MDQIEDCLSFYLGKAYQRVTQSAKQRLAAYGITPVQYALLKVLWEHDQQSGAQLGERLLLDSATMTGPLDREMDQLNQDFLGEFPPEERKLLRNLLTILAGWKQAERPTAT